MLTFSLFFVKITILLQKFYDDFATMTKKKNFVKKYPPPHEKGEGGDEEVSNRHTQP